MVFDVFLEALKDDVTHTYMGLDARARRVYRIDVLYEVDKPQKDVVYVGSPDEVIRCLQSDIEEHLMVISAGDHPAFASLLSDKVSLVITNLSISALCSRVMKVWQSFMDKFNQFQRATVKNQDLQSLVKLMAELVEADVFLLNPGFRLLHGSVESLPREKYNSGLLRNIASELLTQGFLGSQCVMSLNNDIPAKYREQVWLKNIHHSSSILARLLICFPVKNATVFQTSLADALCKALELQMQRRVFLDYSGDEFSVLAIDLIKRNVKSHVEIEERLNMMHKVFKRRYICAVISFADSSEILFPYLMSRLGDLFENSEVFKYKNDIVILTMIKDGNRPAFTSQGELDNLLMEFDAWIGFSPPVSSLSILPMVYYQANAAIRLGRIFDKNSPKRYFYYADYYIYHIVELCMDPVHFGYHNGNMGFLSHPAVLALERHDVQNNDNLRDILFVYLMNNLNSVKTAKEFYVHRNTVLNKIHKIEDILGQSLDDPLLRQNLLVSLAFYNYAKIVYHKNFLDFKT